MTKGETLGRRSASHRAGAEGEAAIDGTVTTDVRDHERASGTEPFPGDDVPFFSVVVPTYARPGRLARCLHAVAALEYPASRVEIVVVDDGSEEEQLRRIRAACREVGATLLERDHAGPGAARNAGAAVARGDFLAFVDDDCEPEPDWLRRLAARFAVSPHAAIGGRTVNALPDDPYASASQALIEYLYDYYDDPALAEQRFFASNNLALPRAGFLSIGGFDEAFTLAAAEDRDLCHRWVHHGNELVYAPDAVVRHSHAMDLAAFCRQHFNYGKGAFRYQRARGRRRRDRMRVEPLRFYTDMLGRPFSRRPVAQATGTAALLLVSQAANAAGFVVQAARDSVRHAVALARLPRAVASFYLRAHTLARRSGDEWTLMTFVPLADVRHLIELGRGRRNVVVIGPGAVWAPIALALADRRRSVRAFGPSDRHEREAYLALVDDSVRSRIQLAEHQALLPKPGEAAVDLLFIDRSDFPDEIVDAFEAWRPHLSPGARVLFHDYGDPRWPRVAEAVERLQLRGESRGRVFVWTSPG